MSSGRPPSIRVLLFARYADLLGRHAIEVPAEQAPTVRAVLDLLRALPGGGHLPADPLVAVNLNHVRGDVPLAPGDEVALLPPLAGG
jgi:molybdopterin converting factor small subunit